MFSVYITPTARKTSRNTHIYAEDFKTIRLTVKEGVSIHLTHKWAKDGCLYGKTPGGWALLRDERTEFIEFSNCLICFDSTDSVFCDTQGARIQKLSCCQKDIHYDCLEAMVKAGHSGKTIGFNHVKCPSCRTSWVDPFKGGWQGSLYTLIQNEWRLFKQIKRLEEIQNQGLPPEKQGDWAFFKCTKCKHPFCGGKISCAEEFDLDPSNMICDGCDWSREAEDHRCFQHGKDYAVFKCDFCCSPASWACGNHHYCQFCHNHGGYQHPQPCPGPAKCPLGIPHPQPVTVDEIGRNCLSFVIGCNKCSNPNAEIEYKSYNPNPFTMDNNQQNLVVKFQYKARPKFSFEWDKAVDLEGGHLFGEESDSEEIEPKDFEWDKAVDLNGGHLFGEEYNSEEIETKDFEWDKAVDLEGGDLFYEESDSEDTFENELIEDINKEVKDVEDMSEGDNAPIEKRDNDILLHAPNLIPPAMVAQSS